jgi:hypothetical protein
VSDLPDAGPEVKESVGFERNDFGWNIHPACQGEMYVVKTDSANFALRLRDDVSRLKRPEQIGTDFVNAQRRG